MRFQHATIVFILTISLFQLGCSTNFIAVEELSITDRIVFTVLDTDEPIPISGAEIFMVGSDWAYRADITDDAGQWSISRTWIDDAEKVLFCWAGGPFHCHVINIDDVAKLPEKIEIRLPAQTLAHRWVIFPETE